MAPIVPKLERLYAWIEAHGYPLAFTTCCSGKMPSEGQLPGLCYVPLQSGEEWKQQLATSRRYYLAKKAHGDPRLNDVCRAWDMFRDNANAADLVRSLSKQWVVFGNGFDLCVGSAASGILDAGLSVILLYDVRISSARGTPGTEDATMRRLQERGAVLMQLEDFLSGAS